MITLHGGKLNAVALSGGSLSMPVTHSVPTSVRAAILALFRAAAYAETGLEDEIAIIESWASEVTSLTVSPSTLSINGVTSQVITATAVPSGSTVTWASSDTTIATVSDGVVTGVANGTCTITASSGDLTARCVVTVTGFATLTSISAVYTQSGTVYDTDDLDDLRDDLVVTAYYDDSTSAVVSDYTLSGTLTEGTSTITVVYGGKTAAFSVAVTTVLLYELPQSIVFNGSSTYIDTGIKLMQTDVDFTIALTAVNGNITNASAPIFHCINEGASPWPGISIQRKNNPQTIYAIGGLSSAQITTPWSITEGITHKIVVRHVAGSDSYVFDSTSDGAANNRIVSSASAAVILNDKNLLIGCYQDVNGNKGRYWAGTISDFKIYGIVLSDNKVSNYLEEA